MVNTLAADTFLGSITQEEASSQISYWEALTPNSLDEMFRRWLFAFTSIHTSWKGNVYGYEALKDFLPWKWNKPELHKKLRKSGCGMHNNRTNFIWDFSKKFWEDPTVYLPQAGEPWRPYRDRLVRDNRGIGIAKVSYVLELCFPGTCRVVCGDIHQCRLYGVNKNLTDNGADKHAYEAMEYHWVVRSYDKGVSPAVARQIYWNRAKKRHNSRFWSYVFEGEEMRKKLDAQDAIIDEAARRETEEPLLVWGENRKPNEEQVVHSLQQA
jgi:hypothetical protein